MEYVLYATSGKEFEVEQDLQAMGIDAWCARKMEFKRRGKKRRPEVVISPVLKNYIWASMQGVDFFSALNTVKHLSATHFLLNRSDVSEFLLFKRAVEADFSAMERVAANSGPQLPQFKRGAPVSVSGPLGERMATFRQIVERTHDLFPKVQVDFEMFGQTVTGEFDPIDVKEVG